MIAKKDYKSMYKAPLKKDTLIIQSAVKQTNTGGESYEVSF